MKPGDIVNGKKFLLYRFGKPVFEGDDTHKEMNRINKEHKGDVFAAAKSEAQNIEELQKQLFKK